MRYIYKASVPKKGKVTSFSDLPLIIVLSSVLLTVNKAFENALRKQAGYDKVKRCLKTIFMAFYLL